MECGQEHILLSPDSSHLTEVFSKLMEMRKSKVNVDCELKTEDGTVFSVHSALLMASSEYFASISKQHNREGGTTKSFDVPDVKTSTMNIIIDFIYFQPMKIADDVLWDLLVGSEKLMFKSLSRKCRAILTKNINPDDCLQVYQRCRQCNLPELEKDVKSYVLKTFGSIPIDNESLMNLDVENLMEIFMDDRLTCGEKHLWSVAKAWMEKYPEQRKGFAPKLLSCIRLGFLDYDFVFENIMRHPLVLHNQECREIVSTKIDLMWDLAEMMSMKHVNTKYIARPRLPKDLLFCVGGHRDAGEEVRAIEVYDNKADIWSELYEDLESRDALETTAHACVVLNHCLYVIGGRDSKTGVVQSTVHCLDLIKKQWKRVASLTKARSGMSAVALADCIVVLGGCHGANVLYSVETFNPRDKKWTLSSCMKKARCWCGACVLGNRIYVAGGTSDHYTPLKSVEVFDAETCKWMNIANLKEPRVGPSSAAYHDKVYVAGGSGLRSVERYDSSTNSWTVISQMNHPREHLMLAVLDDSLYAFGGIKNSAEEERETTSFCNSEEYNETNNSWKPLSKDSNCLRKIAACVAPSLPNVEDYLYYNRENVLEIKRKILYECNLKSAASRTAEEDNSQLA